MNQFKIPTWVLVVSSILAGFLFYGFLFLVSKFFPSWAGRTLANEWVIVLVSSVPLLIVLAFMLVGNISKAKIAGIELEFDRQIPDTALESFKLDDTLSYPFLNKGTEEDLKRIIKEIAHSSERPIFLLVPLEGVNFDIDFKMMRRNVYKLAEVTPIQYIVFVGSQNHYLGYLTVEKFRAAFPRFGVELLIDDFSIPTISHNDVLQIPNLLHEIDTLSNSEYLERLIYRQWKPNIIPSRILDAKYVVKNELGNPLGASEEKVKISAPPSRVYWRLMDEELDGLPAVDNKGIFVGMVTKGRIAQVVIEQLLGKSNPPEVKKK